MLSKVKKQIVVKLWRRKSKPPYLGITIYPSGMEGKYLPPFPLKKGWISFFIFIFFVPLYSLSFFSPFKFTSINLYLYSLIFISPLKIYPQYKHDLNTIKYSRKEKVKNTKISFSEPNTLFFLHLKDRFFLHLHFQTTKEINFFVMCITHYPQTFLMKN